MKSQVFISVDGNGIGRIIESHILANRFAELQQLSETISATIQYFADRIEYAKGQVIMAGGDNLLATIPRAEIDRILSLVEKTLPFGIRFSTGFGPRACDSYLALKYAKANDLPHVGYDAEKGFILT